MRGEKNRPYQNRERKGGGVIKEREKREIGIRDGRGWLVRRLFCPLPLNITLVQDIFNYGYPLVYH